MKIFVFHSVLCLKKGMELKMRNKQNKIHFGMPTLLELETIEDCISLANELGLDFIEINMNMPQFQVEFINANILKRALKNGLYFTFHLDENFNITDFNSKVSEAYLDTILATIELSKNINAPVINMHMAEGIHFKLPNEKVYLFQKYNEYYLSKISMFRKVCENIIADSGIKICIENTNGYLPFMKPGIEFLLESNCFNLTLDIGHNHSTQYIDAAFIEKHIEKLCHMHIHDAIDSKCHLVLGSGEINLREKLSLAIRENCRCVIETKSIQGLRESVSYLQNFLHKLNPN